MKTFHIVCAALSDAGGNIFFVRIIFLRYLFSVYKLFCNFFAISVSILKYICSQKNYMTVKLRNLLTHNTWRDLLFYNMGELQPLVAKMSITTPNTNI